MLIRYYTPSPRNHYEGYKGLEEPRKPRSKTLLKKKERKRREEEIVNPHRYIQNLFGGERHIPIKNKVSSNGVYIQYESNGDTYFKALSLKNYLKKIREHIIDIIEVLKRTRSSRKIWTILNKTKTIKKLKKKCLLLVIM